MPADAGITIHESRLPAPLVLPQSSPAFAIRAIALLTHTGLPVRYPWIRSCKHGSFAAAVRDFHSKSRFWQLLKFHKTIRGASFGSPFSYALSHTFSCMIMYLWSESVKKCNCLARCSVIWWCVTDTCCRCTGVDDLSISYINTYMVDIASAGIE